MQRRASVDFHERKTASRVHVHSPRTNHPVSTLACVPSLARAHVCMYVHEFLMCKNGFCADLNIFVHNKPTMSLVQPWH